MTCAYIEPTVYEWFWGSCRWVANQYLDWFDHQGGKGDTGEPGEAGDRGEKGEMGLSGPSVSIQRDTSSESHVFVVILSFITIIQCVIGNRWAERRERRLYTRRQSGQYYCTHLFMYEYSSIKSTVIFSCGCMTVYRFRWFHSLDHQGLQVHQDHLDTWWGTF